MSQCKACRKSGRNAFETKRSSKISSSTNRVRHKRVVKKRKPNKRVEDWLENVVNVERHFFVQVYHGNGNWSCCGLTRRIPMTLGMGSYEFNPLTNALSSTGLLRHRAAWHNELERFHSLP